MAWLRKKRGIWYIEWRERGRLSPVRTLRVGPRKADADRARYEIERRVLAGRIGHEVLPERVTFREWSDRWLAVRTVRQSTDARDRQVIRTHILPALGDRLLTSLAPEDVARLNAHVTRAVSGWTARRTYAVLRRMLRDARKNRLVFHNVAEDVDAPAKPHAEPSAPSVEGVAAIIEAARQEWRPLILTAALTGLRWGELVALEWGDLDLDTGKLEVRRARPASGTEVGAPKSRTSRRVVDLHPALVSFLKDLPVRGRLVFPATRGGYVEHKWFTKHVWYRALRASGVEAEFHGLRHFFASLLIATGETPLYVAHQLGHSSPGFTLSQYGHLMASGRRLDKDASVARLLWAVGRTTTALPTEIGGRS